MLHELTIDMEGPRKTPAANHLFTVSEDEKKLNE